MEFIQKHCVGLLVIAVLVLVILVVALTSYGSGMAQVNISDAEGRNVGVGTPLDFDVIRPEGFDTMASDACPPGPDGYPVAANACPGGVGETGSAKVVRVLAAPNGCNCSCLCPKQPEDALGTINAISVDDLNKPNPAASALRRARAAGLRARSAVDAARQKLAAAAAAGRANPAADYMFQNAQASADQATSSESNAAAAELTRDPRLANQSASAAEMAANQAVQEARMALNSLSKREPFQRQYKSKMQKYY
jgi:pyruvate/2-oxoglutarate dehydrogenase complex dihydrolipoamide acyltransferase (E2) component